ncbi:helix-turn-helix domain-containing protein [Ruminococcaceae bacterium OttesenSCG-928-D13]|nr:helix-turn-helix domain-containing protein [Ruminococcaceae bacterium OttesenSCG-928-D13]
MTFKDRIKQLREDSHLSFSQLAAVVDKSEGAIRSWETERSKPDIDTLIALAKYFDCTTDYLLGLSGGKKPESAALVDKLGLTDKGIEIIRSGLGDYIEGDASRTIKDVLNMVLETDDFKTLVSYIGVVTTPYDHWAATQWESGPVTPIFLSNSSDPRNREKEAAYKQFAHEELDSLIQTVGQKSVEAYLRKAPRNNEESKNGKT